MKSTPLISIIITNFNYGQYIKKAMKSVLAQDYKNIELVVINDGSTDNSDTVIRGVIAEYPDRKIVYVNRENKGVVYTRNEGMNLAKGKYISYLDADDYFNSDYISKSYKISQEFDADVVYPNWHFVGEWLGRPDTNFPEFTNERLQLQELHCTPASLIRKDAVKDFKFEVEKVAEDWDFFIGLSLSGVKFKLAHDNFINYRIRKGTRGSQNDPRDDTKYFVEILSKYKDKYGDRVIDPQKLVRLRHPGIVRKALSTRYPRFIIESVKKDGVKKTTIRVAGKIASRNQWVWKTVGYVRNQRYKRITRSLSIQSTPRAKLAVILHLYYPDTWPAIKENLSRINVPFDVFVSVQEHDANLELDRVNEYHGATNIVALPNRGRDVLPFLFIARILRRESHYKYILKIHSKKSLHRNDGSEWLESLLGELIPQDVSSVIDTLNKKNTGVIGPAEHITSLSRYIGGNWPKMRNILQTITTKKEVDKYSKHLSHYPFFGGTMFWCRLDFLDPLLGSSYVMPADFSSERGQVDATTAHAVERLMGKLLHEASGKKMYTVNGNQVNELPDKSYDSKYKFVH